MDEERLRRALGRPEAYPCAPERVERIETHISLLFFAGDRVYKVKKAVDFGFLDFTTLERRRHFCEEELRLNRRLSPAMYLGVVPIVETEDGGLRVGGTGEPVEWAVEMARLPADAMLDALLAEGAVDNRMMRGLARLLARFHARAETGEGVDRFGRPEAVASLVKDNFEHLETFAGDEDDGAEAGLRALSRRRLEFLEGRARTFLEERRELFERRVAEGRIRDGHGDLHAGNICYRPDGIAIYDCIEFSERFRCSDVACDLAFLAMDLDRRGFPAFASYLVREYRDAAGDGELEELMDFYKAYRAAVRAKVACLTAVGEGADDDLRERKRCEAADYLDLAAGYSLPPRLILMCGLPGSGKSTVARALARPLRAVVHRSDVRRQVQAAESGRSQGGEGYGKGLYAPEVKSRTYEDLLGLARHDLAQARTVVVDATFSLRSQRGPFRSAAEALGAPVHVVEVSASEEVTRARLERRAEDPHEPSEADFSIYLRAREGHEPPGDDPDLHVVAVPSDREPLEESVRRAIDAMIPV